jgi:hypothetical protein
VQTKTLDKLLPQEYQEHLKVFEKQASEQFPESWPWDHAINLKPDFVLKDCKIYPLSPTKQKLMYKLLEENLAKGYIWPSKSPMASLFFFVSKKDSGALQPCQDYRYLNNGTVKNMYPLPLIGDLLDKLRGAQWFTKMDSRRGYHNVWIKEGDEWKGTFKTNKGLFEQAVMFFRLCNSPMTFQAMMNDIFKDMINEGWIVDDILIFSKDKDEHQKRTKQVLQRLQEHDLYLKVEKCKFDVQEVEFLGFIICPNEMHMDPMKLQGISNWLTPTNVKAVRSFLGFGSFYWRFIGHFTKLMKL